MVINNYPVLPAKRSRQLAQTDLWSLPHRGYVLDAQWGSGFRENDRLFDILDASHQTDFPHIDLLHAGFDKTSSGVGVVVCEMLFYLCQAQSVCHELVRIDAYLVFPCRAAKTRYINHIRH